MLILLFDCLYIWCNLINSAIKVVCCAFIDYSVTLDGNFEEIRIPLPAVSPNPQAFPNNKICINENVRISARRCTLLSMLHSKEMPHLYTGDDHLHIK